MKKLTALLLAAVLLFGLNFGGALSEQALVRRFGGEILSSYTVIPSVAARVPKAALPDPGSITELQVMNTPLPRR